MQYTTNYNLKKPSYTDPADIEDINANMDVLDAELQARESDTNTHATNTSNPHGVNKSQVGLGNVDNVKQAPYTHTQDSDIHRKITSGTAEPSGGSNGDIYLQYE
jgi:hypothetical protein